MRLLSCISLAALVGCSNMAIEGTVVDVTGAPVVGANISAVGDPTCSTKTDEAGAWELVCNPATYDLVIGAAGYLSESVEQYDANERQRYSVGKKVLIKIPTEKGLLKFDGQSYTSMEPGHIIKVAGGKGTSAFKHYCLDEKADIAVNAFTPGNHALFDNQSDGWKPFKLDEEGCAYRMSPTTDTRWGIDYAEKAAFETTQVANDQEIVFLTLESGRYFIADWDQGFFNKVKGEDGETMGYAGFYIEVQ
ncbi:MAG: carboxypeptidase regulatory-like domain-containing protein [Proteobacteria bacterium]|nr:carboxypeptidase regulatory-like domain-containing protein [Pseudomonadota bacterium]